MLYMWVISGFQHVISKMEHMRLKLGSYYITSVASKPKPQNVIMMTFRGFGFEGSNDILRFWFLGYRRK